MRRTKGVVATLQPGENNRRKEESWSSASIRTDKNPVDPNFFWVTQDCEVLHPTEMRTFHLFNALKMIWNHTMPVAYRILPHTQYKGVKQWPKELRKKAVANLFSELMNRADRTQGMEDALRRMAEMIAKHGRKRLGL